MPILYRPIIYLLVLQLAVLAGDAFADDTEAGTSTPQEVFRAEYKGKYRGFKVKTYRSLTLRETGSYQYLFRVQHPLAQMTETSDFLFNSGQPMPLRYLFSRKILGVAAKEQILFDWKAKKASYSHSRKPERNGEQDIATGVADPLLFQLLLQQRISLDKEPLSFSFIKRTSLKEYTFSRTGEESISIDGKEHTAILVERVDAGPDKQLYMWFVPDLGYQLGKIRYVESGGNSYELELTRYESNAPLMDAFQQTLFKQPP